MVAVSAEVDALEAGMAELGLTNAGLARALGCHPNTVGSWRAGKSEVPRMALLALSAMVWGLGPYPDCREAEVTVRLSGLVGRKG